MQQTEAELRADHAAEIERLKTAHAAELLRVKEEHAEEINEHAAMLYDQHAHEMHHVKYYSRQHFAREVQEIIDACESSYAILPTAVKDMHAALLKRYGYKTHMVILVDGAFDCYYNKEREQHLCDVQANWAVWHFTDREMKNLGIPLPEEVAQNA